MANQKVQEMMDRALGDLRRLQNARSSAAAREAWGDFLSHANTAINRLEAHAKRSGQSDKHKRLRDEIWADPLASYMRTARNAGEHGVEDIDVEEPNGQRLAFANGVMMASPLIGFTDPDGNQHWSTTFGLEVVEGPPARKVPVRPTVRMVPVMSKKGDLIAPPVPPILFEDEPEVVAVARGYLAWIEAKVATFD